MSLFMRKKYEKVVTCADKVLSIDPNHMGTLFYKGKLT